ncbi:conserved protein of unknown function [Candidatus Hydrogenisulfobacillus filiaventi]|uniref:PilZ domain-containing protein n=1 Tax=Candidatus Hydrogenisulfobacillus filiaventi TaxID=2707344 RepID=A0A6F8ZH61_9FIRM|nr:PilZ domain-containing protein [Bacillota bacterium]CAB1129053.1 conserved protein of unknown function [Candidatus Hydrogenisulfobacillus filiaventi]
MARDRGLPAGPAERPPVRAAVTVRSGEADFSSLVLKREGEVDYLDAPRTPGGEVVYVRAGEPVAVIWGDGPRAFLRRAVVVEVLDPVPGLVVRYQGPAQRINRRREARSLIRFPGRYRLEGGDGWHPTITRDGSASGLRFFVEQPLPAGSRVELRIRADDAEIAGTVTLLRVHPAPATYLDREGRDAVGLWDPPLTGPAAAAWRAALRRHLWDT